MSAVLKSGSAALRDRVRPFAAPFPRAARPDPEIERLGIALAEAEAALAVREGALAEVPALLEAARSEAEAVGRAAVEDDQAERTALLAGAVERALASYAEELGALERLAPLLARICLEKMLIADEHRIGTVTALLRARLAALEAGAAVRILVSEADFSSPEALAALAPAPCEVVATPSLAAGQCSIRLRLGTLEVGVGQQWGALAAALEELAA